MPIKLAAALIYWAIVALWLAVLGTVIVSYVRNPRLFGTTRMLLIIVGIDTCRNIVENIYFGLFFGSQYGLFSSQFAEVLGRPELLIVPKLMNVAAGALVLGLLLLHWLPGAERERDNSDREAAELETLAAVDGLTDIYNRRHFFALAEVEWDRFKRYHRPLSVLMIDIDHFKKVNDIYGHEVGDRSLIQLARACEQVKRQSDILARMGGEEFIVLLPETDRVQAALAAERFRQAVAETPIWISEDASIHITISVGVAEATASMPAVGVLIKSADEQLYYAKASGRNCVAQGVGIQEEIASAAE